MSRLLGLCVPAVKKEISIVYQSHHVISTCMYHNFNIDNNKLCLLIGSIES